MKGIVKSVDTFETTVVDVECPACGTVTSFEYPYDEGYYKTNRTEKCGECDEELEFTYGEK